MTERGRRALRLEEDALAVGRSSLRVEGDTIVVEVDERCAPIPRRVRGRITLRAPALAYEHYAIDRAGEHRWCPLAPSAPIEVEMDAPSLSWSGTGYFDMNWGERPLEETFEHWNWMRVDLGEGRSAIVYETTERDGEGPQLALLGEADGRVSRIPAPTRHPLPAPFWRVARTGWADAGEPQVRRTLEDTPFYTRTELATTMLGAPRTAIHESLSLRRLRQPIVKLMLPFRMPRLP